MTTLNLTAQVLAKFPARVLAGAGMLITKVNGVWTFAISGDNLVQQPITDPANTFVFVEMPDGSIAQVPVSSLPLASIPAEQTGKKNAFINATFKVWQRNTNIFNGVTTTRTFCADRWGVKTAAGTLQNYQRSIFYNLGPHAQRGWGGASLTGNAGVTTVNIDQRIESTNLSTIYGPVTFSALIFNGSGSAFSPRLFVSTPTARDNWAVSNVRNGGGAGDALQSCANGLYTRVSWGADLSTYTDIINGVEFAIQFPNGSLDANTKTVGLLEPQVEPRPLVDSSSFSLFEEETFPDELARCQRYYYKSFPYATVPATNAGVATGPLAWAQIVGAAAAQPGGLALRWPAVMRAAPTTITTYNPAAANAQPRNETVGADCSAVATANPTDSGVVITCTTAAGSAAGNRMSVHVTADAEL